MPKVYRGTTKWTPELEETLWGLFQYGLRSRDVAEKMGLSIATVENRYRKLKLQREQKNDG